MNNLYISIVLYGLVGKMSFTEIRYATLEKDSHSVLLNCENDQLLSVLEIAGEDVDDIRCRDDDCENQKLLEDIRSQCDNSPRCMIESHQLGFCSRVPLHISIEYACYAKYWKRWTWWWRFKTLCSDSLHQIDCGKNSKIYIDEAELPDVESEWFEFRDYCVKNQLKYLCNGMQSCHREISHTSCLFESRSVEISFVCIDEQTSNRNETENPTVNTFSSPSPTTGTNESAVVTNLPTEYTLSYTQGNIGLTNLPQMKPTFEIEDGRVWIIFMNGQVRRTLCGDGWGDEESTVLCRYLQNTTGVAIQSISFPNTTPYPFLLSCIGNEPSLFQCEFIMNDGNCSSDKVAGARCCDEDICKEQETIKQSLQKDDIGKGAIAGSVLAGITVVVVVVIFAAWLLRRRLSNHSLDQKRTIFTENSNQRDDYTGTQDINLPNSDQRAPKTFIYSVANDTCHGDTTIENGSDGYFVLEKENHSTKASADGRNYEYATSSDVTQDNAKGLKQKFDKENVYSHATDGVYDQTANTKRKPSEEAVYSHSVDGIYDKTSDTKHVNNDDNVYSHSVDDFYDKLRQKETSTDADDTYNHTFGATTEDDYNLAQ